MEKLSFGKKSTKIPRSRLVKILVDVDSEWTSLGSFKDFDHEDRKIYEFLRLLIVMIHSQCQL